MATSGTAASARQPHRENVKRLPSLVTRIYARLDRLEWIIRLVVRIAVGIEFFGSGLGKLGKLSGLVQYFRSLGIPAPEIQAPLVASTELVCGAVAVASPQRGRHHVRSPAARGSPSSSFDSWFEKASSKKAPIGYKCGISGQPKSTTINFVKT